jgi:chemotaxis protein histidine kinase CheA
MDVNTKVKELEDELKVLKTEIRNVLLDVREVILDRANPLSEQEPAYLRVDLKTTAQTIAAEEAARSAADLAEEAARAASKAAEQAKREEQTENPPEEPADSAGDEDGLPPETETAEEATGEEGTDVEPAAQDTDEEPTEDELEEPEDDGLAEPEPPPKREAPRRRKRPPEAGLEPAEILAAYRFYPPLAIGTGSLAAWVAEAMAAIGPQQLDRVITIHRLWGYLPPNISQALAHLQELIRCSQEAEPAWLKTMQDMERLSSS